MQDVILLAGGWSVSCYNIRGLEERGMLIAVNESAVFTKPQIALTMDRLFAEYRYRQLNSIQGVPKIWLRKGIAKNFIPDPNTTVEFVHVGEVPTLMTSLEHCLNGSNSGTCALNLAYQLRPPRVFLLGYDMCRGPKNEPYWHEPYPWMPHGSTKKSKYVEWSKEFQQIAQQFENAGIQVYNVNHRSEITVFEKLSYEYFCRMTADRRAK